MTPHQLEMLLESPLSSVATFGEVVITVVHTELTVEALRMAVAAGHKVAAVYPRGAVGLNLVNVGIQLPSIALRREASEAMAATRSQTRCVARVFVGHGFWTSTMRSVLTAIELLRPYDRPRRTFGELRTATRWLASTCGEDVRWAERLDAAARQVAGSADEVRAHAW